MLIEKYLQSNQPKCFALQAGDMNRAKGGSWRHQTNLFPTPRTSITDGRGRAKEDEG